MAKYVDQDGKEFSSANLGCALVMVLAGCLIVSGAVAAIPAFFGAVTVAAWTWLILAGIGGVFTGLAYVNAKSILTRVDE